MEDILNKESTNPNFKLYTKEDLNKVALQKSLTNKELTILKQAVKLGLPYSDDMPDDIKLALFNMFILLSKMIGVGITEKDIFNFYGVSEFKSVFLQAIEKNKYLYFNMEKNNSNIDNLNKGI